MLLQVGTTAMHIAALVLTMLCCMCTCIGCSSHSIGSLSTADHWVPVRVSDPGVGSFPERYGKITFSTRDEAWVTCSGGLLSTTDAGRTWVQQSIPANTIDFVNDRIGWIMRNDTGGGGVGRTLDGGLAWKWGPAVSGEVLDVDAVSGAEAWAIVVRAGGRTVLLHTADGGASWEEARHPYSRDPDASLDALFFLDSRRGWVICGIMEQDPTGETLARRQPRILRTGDGGKTFQVSSTPWVRSAGSRPFELDFTSAQEGWAAVGDASLLHTEDGGRNWKLVNPSIGGQKTRIALRSCSFPTRVEGWAVGEGGVALHTSDGGKTWVRVRTGTENVKDVQLWRVAFADARHGLITGEGGVYPSDFPVQRSPHLVGFILKYVP